MNHNYLVATHISPLVLPPLCPAGRDSLSPNSIKSPPKGRFLNHHFRPGYSPNSTFEMETWHATMTPLGRTHPWLRENGHRGIVTSRNKIDEKEGKGTESLPHISLYRPNYSDSLEYCLVDIRTDGLQQKEIHNWDGNSRRQRTTTTMKRVHSSFTNTHPSTSSLLYEKPNFNVHGIIIVPKLKWNSLWGNWTDTLETTSRIWATMTVPDVWEEVRIWNSS